MTPSTVQPAGTQALAEAIARVCKFLGIPQRLVALYPSRQSHAVLSAVQLIALPQPSTAAASTLSEEDQDKERAWIVSSLLQEISASNETVDYRHRPVRVALESVLRWIRSFHATMAFSTIISLVDVITAWIASSSSSSSSPLSSDSSSSSSIGGLSGSEDSRDILESMLVTLATLLAAAYINAGTDDDAEELSSLLASVVGQMAAYASDSSIPEPVRCLAIGVASTLVGECFTRFKSTEAPFLLQIVPTTTTTTTTSSKSLTAYEKFLQLLTSDDVWGFLKALSLAPGATIGLLGSRGSSPIATAAIHALLSYEIASALRGNTEQPWTGTEDSCRNLERRIIYEAVAIHGNPMMALVVLYGKGLAHPPCESDSLAETKAVDQIKARYQLDSFNSSDLDDAMSRILSPTTGSPSLPPEDKTRYPVPTSLADHGWFGTTVLRQILIDTVSKSDSTPRLLQDSPYSTIYIVMGLMIVDAGAPPGSASRVGQYIEQRLHLGDPSCLDTMLNLSLSIIQESKADARAQSFRLVARRALVHLTTTASQSSCTIVQRLFGSIQKTTWVRLGTNCHNASFQSRSKAASSGAMDGSLKLLEWIHQRQASSDHAGQEHTPLLWILYDILITWHQQQQQADEPMDDRQSHSSINSINKDEVQRRANAGWPLHFLLRSYCPEVVMVGCMAWFRWSNACRPFPTFPKALAEALDYGLQTQVEASTKAIQSLFQTMIASKFYTIERRAQATAAAAAKAQEKQHRQQQQPLGLGLQAADTAEGKQKEEGEDIEMGEIGEEEEEGEEQGGRVVGAPEDQDHVVSLVALTETMTAMYWAWSDFVDEGHGRSVPKLAALFQAELAADTKQRSKKAAAEARGVKRGALAGGDGPTGTAGTGAGAGTTGSGRGMGGGGVGLGGGSKASKLEAVKKQKSSSVSPFESSPLLGSLSSDGSVTFFGPRGASMAKQQQQPPSSPQPPPLQLVSTSDLLASFKTASGGGGGSLTTVGTVSNLSNMTQSAQQAKVSNPLWAPVLGLSHVPQMQARHQTHIQLEVQRWMGLLAHMDGPTFSEHLTALIKAVYPSDQKFLLDQVLVELMALQDSAQNETIDGIKQSLKESRYYFVPDGGSSNGRLTNGVQARVKSTTQPYHHHHDSKGAHRFSTEWIVETVIGALVSMVIKPEEQPGYMEPGSLKWMEPVPEQAPDWRQILDALTVLESRSLSSSPSPTWPSSLVPADRLYFVNDLQRLAQEGGFVLDPNGVVADAISMSSPATNVVSPAAAMSGGGGPARPKAAGTAAGGAVTKKRRLRNLYNRRVSPFYATLIMFQRKWTTSGHGAGMTFLGPEEGDAGTPAAAAAGAAAVVPQTGWVIDTTPTVMDEPAGAASSGGVANSSGSGGGGEGEDENDIDDDDESDEAMLRRAQQAEKRTLACQAPIRTLLVILQTLTKMNQGGALDAWIVDALAGTIDVVQDRYFEWVVEVLRLRVTSTMATTTTCTTNEKSFGRVQQPFGSFMTLEQGQVELLRLVPILTAAPGIGMGPLKRAFQRSVAYHQKEALAAQQAWRTKVTKLQGGGTGDDVFSDPMTTTTRTAHWRQLEVLVGSTQAPNPVKKF